MLLAKPVSQVHSASSTLSIPIWEPGPRSGRSSIHPISLRGFMDHGRKCRAFCRVTASFHTLLVRRENVPREEGESFKKPQLNPENILKGHWVSQPMV